MGLSGSGGEGGSYLPQGLPHGIGPSYFEDQNSIESMNMGGGIHIGGLSGGSQNPNTHLMGYNNMPGSYL